METLVGKKAPYFSAKAVVNGGDIIDGFSLDQYLGKKHVLFFFYPLDFTFVCPTEIIAFQEKLAEFEKRGVAVVACSVDSEFSHWAWLNTEPKILVKPLPTTTEFWPEIITTTMKATSFLRATRSPTGASF
jgi:peroxiredoxin 2/4